MVVFGSFRGEEGDSSSVMDLSHISQDKMLPEVSLVNREEDEDENMMIFTHFHLLSKKVFRMSGQCDDKGKRTVFFASFSAQFLFLLW